MSKIKRSCNFSLIFYLFIFSPRISWSNYFFLVSYPNFSEGRVFLLGHSDDEPGLIKLGEIKPVFKEHFINAFQALQPPSSANVGFSLSGADYEPLDLTEYQSSLRTWEASPPTMEVLALG